MASPGPTFDWAIAGRASTLARIECSSAGGGAGEQVAAGQAGRQGHRAEQQGCSPRGRLGDGDRAEDAEEGRGRQADRVRPVLGRQARGAQGHAPADGRAAAHPRGQGREVYTRGPPQGRRGWAPTQVARVRTGAALTA